MELVTIGKVCDKYRRRGKVACNGEISVSGVLTHQARIDDGCLAIGTVKPCAYDKAKNKKQKKREKIMRNIGKLIAAIAAAATIIYTGYYVAGIGTDRIQQYRETQSIQFQELDR